MEELLVASEKKPEQEGQLVYPHNCPVCGIESSYVYRIEEGKTHQQSSWTRCQCGVIFQDDLPADEKIYDDTYVAALFTAKMGKERYEYYVRTYGHLIEELTYGRMMLDVGFATPYLTKAFEERGWLTWGIDICPALAGQKNIYTGDFTDYDFSLKGQNILDATGLPKIDRTFDLIWMGHVLEHFHDPIAALKKAKGLLEEKGVLFISTPDIDFINKTGAGGWPHFKKREHYVMWSEIALKRELERLGFKVIMCRRNFSARYISWYDIHIIAQQNYF